MLCAAKLTTCVGRSALEQRLEFFQVVVEVDALEANLAGPLRPLVGQQRFVRLIGTAGGEDVGTGGGQMIAERRAGERVGAKHEISGVAAHSATAFLLAFPLIFPADFATGFSIVSRLA